MQERRIIFSSKSKIRSQFSYVFSLFYPYISDYCSTKYFNDNLSDLRNSCVSSKFILFWNYSFFEPSFMPVGKHFLNIDQRILLKLLHIICFLILLYVFSKRNQHYSPNFMIPNFIFNSMLVLYNACTKFKLPIFYIFQSPIINF